MVHADMTEMNHKIIIAHRGASGYLPEHTIAAKVMAYSMNADYIEQDVILSKDRVTIVLHDLELNEISNVAEIFPGRARADGKYYVIDFNLDELKQLWVSERKRDNGKPRYPGRFPPGKSDFRIVTLQEEIELIQGLNKSRDKDIGLYTEIKSPAWHKQQGYDISPAVLELLKDYGYTDESDNIYIQCFDPHELLRIRNELNSHLKLVQLIGENSWNEADTDYEQMQTAEGLRQVASYANGIGPSIDHILESRLGKVSATSLVEEAHKHKMVVHPYTLRDDNLPQYVSSFKEIMQYLLIDADVDGVFTDFPDLGVQYRDEFSKL
jgi:glycerophosphoryl diester phosphodiesterase